MIIVEGMDGTGKSNLVRRIHTELGLPIHERASDSISGPVSDLFDWAERDVKDVVQPFAVYDRHPLVSEFIYGPICRGTIDDRFFSPNGRMLSRSFRSQNLVIFCDPGLDVIAQNVERAAQMKGVDENIDALYWTYRSIAHHWSGRGISWNYLTSDWDTIVASISFQRKIYELGAKHHV